ncbi:MAG: hypothetical protein KF708_15555 [Pirellulales bacterium]|nr:hypothetical protein [Pirellulales bacterium]
MSCLAFPFRTGSLIALLGLLLCLLVAGNPVVLRAQEPSTPAATEPTPPTAPAPAATPAAPAPTAEGPSYVALIDPAIAQQLGLSEAQSTKIRKLVAERAESLRDAPESKRPEIIAAVETQLAAVLTEDQRAAWQRMIAAGKLRPAVEAPTEKKLRFSFRFQPWTDVLSWFADQAGLSLVLDAPPPGSFNYTDSREYTVADAIDLLNGVLLTKGYTLIRRDNMLMLLNVTEGVPGDLVPRVTLEELTDRGKFEIVSVLFPVETRDPAQVTAEITPLLGPQGKATPLTATRQILVTDTAGKMRSIAAVIESMPLPSSAVPSAKPGEPEKSVLVAYPLDAIDAAVALEMIKALMPDAKAALDQRLGQIAVFATPTQHAGIQLAMDEMRKEAPADKKPELKVYPLRAGNARSILDFLMQVTPSARLAIDPKTGSLAAWATPGDQELIAGAVSQLDTDSADRDRTLEVYTLHKAEPATMVAALAALVPEARISAGGSAGRVVAFATPTDHERIKELIARLDVDVPAEQVPQLQVYQLTFDDVAELTTLLAKVVPKAQATFDQKAKRLSVIATPADQETVRATVEQVEKATPKETEDELQTHKVSLANHRKVTTALSTLGEQLPGIRVIPDATTGEIAIWAQPDQHATIATIISQLDRELPPEEQAVMTTYRLERFNPQSALPVLRTLLPEAQVIVEPETRQIIVVAKPRDQATARATIESMDADLPAEGERPRIVVYPVQKADPVPLATMLQAVVPNARLSADRTNQSLAAWATPADHETIRAAVEQMDSKLPPEKTPTVVVYPLRRANGATSLYVLQTLVPTARVAIDANTGSVVAWGTPEDHAALERAIAQMEEQPSAELQRTLSVYPIGDADPSSLVVMLQSVVKDARVLSDARSHSVLAWGTADEHAAIREAIEQLNAGNTEDQKPIAKVYRLEAADPTAALSTMQALVPTARIAIDTRQGGIVATALPAEHERLAAAVAEMDHPAAAGEVPEVKVYPLQISLATNVYSTLTTLYATRPEIRFSLDPTTQKLIAWAPPSQQEKIRSVIEEIEGTGTPEATVQLEVHPLGTAESYTVLEALTPLFVKSPEVKLSASRRSKHLVALARPDQQRIIRQTIEQMQTAPQELEVFPLTVVDPFTAQMAIERLFDDDGNRFGGEDPPKIDSDAATGQLVVRGSAAQLKEIRSLLAKMGEPLLVEIPAGSSGGGKLRVIRMGRQEIDSAMAELSRVWPQLRKNPIRVVTPSAVAPTLRESRETQPPAPPAPAPDSPDTSGIDGEPLDGVCQLAEADPATSEVAAEPAADEEEAESIQPPSELVEPTPPPIIVAPSNDRITISSDDLEALDQFEALLRNLAQSGGGRPGREFTVFNLKSANAADMADTLQKLFRGGFFGGRGSGIVTIVPDTRLNALIVQAGQADLRAIEALLEVLDSADVPDTLVATKPKQIQIHNARAEEIEDVLRDVYQTQLTSGGAKLPIPSGVPRELASVLQQLGASSSGPLMTLAVDQLTNSIIVLAPGPLLVEVEQLVHSLDEAAADPARTVRVVPLKKTNILAVEEAIGRLSGQSGFGGGGGSRPRPRRVPRRVPRSSR